MNSKSVKDNYIGRVSADLHRILATVLREKVQDDAFIDTEILRVEASADLSSARVYVNNSAEALTKLNGMFRNEVAQNMRIKRIPTFRFIVEKGGENTKRVEELLEQIKRQ